MNKTRVQWIGLVILFLVAMLIITGVRLPVRAESSSPAEMLARAWQYAQEAGSYRFISDINQTLIPRPVPGMIGQQETALDLAIDGAVVLPDGAYTEMKVLTGQRSESVAILRDGNQSFLLKDGEIKPVDNPLNLASQSNDLLSYLAAADQVALIAPPEGHPELARYGFKIDGPRYAEYVRQQAEAALQAEPGAPQGLTIKPIPTLQQLSGQGELWVNQAGLPVRQVLDIQIPEVNEQYNARIHMIVDFSSYGQVEALPKIVQGPDGKWQLNGTLPAGISSNLGEFQGFGAIADQSTAGRAESSKIASNWWSQLASKLPLRVSPTSVIILVVVLLVVIIVLFYRRNARRCYALIVFILIPIMVLSPLLESAGVIRFMERQAQAAADRSGAVPDLLRGLGFDPQEIEAAANQDSAVKAEETSNSLAMQQSGGGGIKRCGDGEVGVDTDSDGLTDKVELCLGTNPNLADTDQDGIPDKTEIVGFEYPAGSGKYWASDPLNPDSNSDGQSDLMEWPARTQKDGQEITTNGLAANEDLDNDGIPNIWDNDDDEDKVPDAQDLSPYAVTGFTTAADLSTEGSDFNGYETIEIQVQPEELEHLRYSTTALDWPNGDNDGNVQDLDDSSDDLRLSPFLIVTTNVAPDQSLGDKYGFRSWLDTNGKYILMAPLVAIQNNGAIHSYYAKIAYAPGQTADIQWQAQMMWLAQMQSDTSVNFTVVPVAQTLHEYQDSFRITGLKVTKDQGYEAAVFGTPYQADDLYLFRLLLGLNATYKSYAMVEGQIPGQTALQAMVGRFSDPNATVFEVPASDVAVAGPVAYGHLDAGLAGVGSGLVPGLLEHNLYKQYYENGRCNDAEGFTVNCASLIIAYESSSGIRDLTELPKDASGLVDLTRLHINLAEVALVTTRGVQMNVYEQNASSWQITTAARMLELMEQRYHDEYATAMRALYPNLTVDDLRFMTYAAYLWATNPSYNPISVDGQVLVDELPNEAELAANWILKPEEDAVAVDAVAWWAVGCGIAAALAAAGGGVYGGYGLYKLSERQNWAISGGKLSGPWNGVGAGLLAVTLTATMIMSIINALCPKGSELPMCRNKTALKAANIFVKSLGIVAATYKFLTLAYRYATDILNSVTKFAKVSAAVGMVVGIAMVWVNFGVMFAANGGMGNPVMANTLVDAIVMTIYLIVMFIITCIPVIGQVITALMAVLDAIFYLFTWLFTGTGQTVVQAILKFFYDAQACVEIGDGSVSFGEYSTDLEDPDQGLVGGNTIIVSSPFEAALVETAYGNQDDLEQSTIYGTLSDEYLYYKPEETKAIFPGQEMSEEEQCRISDIVKYCSNTARIGFSLAPKINGILPVQPIVNYTIAWAAFGGGGLWRYDKTHYMSGILPEDAMILKPSFMYLDVLPADLTELWNWSALTNNDVDGDGLTKGQEDILLTSDDDWDSDDDGISDYYEWQNGTNPRAPDSDGDSLDDGLELRLGTNPKVGDSDGDGLNDADEVRRYENGVIVGGWQVSIEGVTYWVSSDPLRVDRDGDDLNDAEEKDNGLSPRAANQPVPSLNLSVTPLSGIPGQIAGAFWQQNQNVAIHIYLANGSPNAVTSNLALSLPGFLENVQVLATEGDRTPALTVNGNLLSWSFGGAAALQTYEYVDIQITATTSSASGSGPIDLSLPFNSTMLNKAVSVVLDSDNPDVAILAPTDGAYLRGTSYVVGGAATDPTTWITTMELSIVPMGNSPSFQTLPSTSSPWASGWQFAGEGVYTLQARATDAMGHTSTSTPVNVTVDNTPPVVTLTSNMAGGVVHLSGAATDNLAGVPWVRLSLDGQPWRSVSLNGSAWSYDWTVGESAQGEHQATVMAIDRSGNQSAINTQTITVDSVAPSSIVNAGADPDTPPAVKANTSFNIRGVADEGGHLPMPVTPVDLKTGLNVFNDSRLWLGLSTIHDNDGGVLAAWIGDFNADRLADLAVGLPGPVGDGGQVSILYGRAGDWPTPPDLKMLANSPTRFSGVSGVRLGSLLAAAGDANGDNFSDLLIGERASTRAFLIFGIPGSQGDLTLDSGHSGYRTLLQAPANIEGLAAAGDVDGDGYGDLLIRAGGAGYLLLGRGNPWPETIDLATEKAASISPATGALGVGDVDGDQLDEWVILKSGSVTLYGWNASTSTAEVASTRSTADTAPRAVALGDVDEDGKADWLYSNGTDRILVYAGGGTHTFSGYGGFFAAPGDVDGDERADILLTTTTGVASLVHQPKNGTLTEFATIQGVGGAANAPYSAGADLNSDGSDDLLLIPSQEAAQARGFDAPDFSSGFISPQSLPLGASSVSDMSSTSGEDEKSPRLGAMGLSTVGSDTLYVDDDAVSNTCDGHSLCYTTIQLAVDASDGGGDTIIVYPGVYAAFSVPAVTKNNQLTIRGLSPDAVFVEGGAGNAITVSADGVHLSNLTVRKATNGIALDYSAGEPPVGSGNETSIDHVLAHSVSVPISMDGASALSLSDSTLVGDGVHPIVSVSNSSNIYTWNTDPAVPAPIGSAGALVSAGSNLYALPGGGNSNIYAAAPATGGGIGSWSQPFKLQHPLPTNTGTTPTQQGTNLLVGGATTISQLHSNFVWPNLGGLANNVIYALAVDPNNGDIYAGGDFTRIGTNEFFYLARWDGTKWNKVKAGMEPNNHVHALAFDNLGNLYVGGEFTQIGTLVANHVARWNVSSASWSVLGSGIYNGVDGAVNALIYESTLARVHIGGAFAYSTEYFQTSTPAKNITAWNTNCTPASGSYCFVPGGSGTNGAVNALALGYFRLYVGGSFNTVGTSTPALNIAYYDLSSGQMRALSAGLTDPVKDIAVLSQYRLAVASGSVVREWDGSSTWSLPAGYTYGAEAVAVDAQGNVYTGDNNGNIKIQPGGSGAFQAMAIYAYFPVTPGGWTYYIYDLVIDGAGQLYGGSFGYDHYNSRTYGAIYRWAPASFYRHPAGSGNWTRLTYPPTATMADAPTAVAADTSDNLYAVWGGGSTGRLYYYEAATNTWIQKANPPSDRSLYQLVWAGSYLYTLGQSGAPWQWSLVRYDPVANTWTELAKPLIPDGSPAVGRSLSWDGVDHIYLLHGTRAFARYSISANAWETISIASGSFTISYGPAMAFIGGYLYIYGTPDTGVATNLFRYGSLPASDLRLMVDRTAFVVPETASSITWTNLGAATGGYLIRTDIDNSNAWVGPGGVSAYPAIPSGAARLTWSQADFAAPEDGLYRLGANSTLAAGYHHYKAAAHVYTSQAACTGCASGSLTWGVDAFSTVRQAVESGASRVLVHPGRYPQTFYLVSGVEVVGAGAESTIIEPPTGAASTLVTAEGAAGSSLARLTLAGGAAWDGFLAEGGAKGLKLTRAILRDLKTGVRLRGDAKVEIVNNTIVGNADGIVIEGTTPVNVRNTIMAYNSGAGLTHGAAPTSRSNTYNDFWSNGSDMNPLEVSPGSLFANPHFRSYPDDNLRLSADSPLIDKGATSDSTPPGGGQRVDIGYAEYNAASFYVSHSYSETSLNDGLMWGVEAFDAIQPALNAAAAALHNLQGAEAGGYSVAVDTGAYPENVMVPSHVRLVGSGAEVTSISPATAGSAVTFDGVIDSELSGFTVTNTSGMGVEIKGASSGILISRNVIRNNTSLGIRLAENSSAEVLFNTIVNNTSGAGVVASGAGSWVDVRNNILSGNTTGLQTENSALVRNDYNLLNNTTNLSNVTAGDNTLFADPLFAASTYFVPSAASPAVDAADPLSAAPPAGGLRADLGYKELIASPLTLVFGPEIASTITANTGLSKVEVGVALVSDATLPVIDTLPTTWQTLTPAQSGQPLFYWSQSMSQATPGYYRVYSRATDAAGNTEAHETDWYEGAFLVDNTAPTLSWVKMPPASTDAAAVLAAVNVSGTVSTGTGTRDDVSQVYYRVTGPSGTVNYPATGGQAWIPLPTTGSYTISAIAVDEAGNQATLGASVNVSATTSVATISYYSAEGDVNSTIVTVQGYVRFTAAGTGVVDVSVNGGAAVPATLASPGAQFSAWSVTITLPAGQSINSITATPRLNGTNGKVTILDLSAPTLTVTSPTATEKARQNVAFAGTASDSGSGLAAVEVSLDGGYTWQQAAISGGNWSLTWYPQTGLDYVSFPAQVRAVDAAGNVTLIELTVRVDNVAPSGLVPVTFSQPVGQHLEKNDTLAINWSTPVDASGTAVVLLVVDTHTDTVPASPANLVTGSSATANLNTAGDWYVHLMAQDEAGNQLLTRFGPWHVGDKAASPYGNRRKSIIIDGYIDLLHNEWKANELLGEDARSGNPQELYATWDGQHVFLGWSGAWWTLNGVLWAYLDTVESSGATTTVDGTALPAGLYADRAVEINSPGEGSLWIWDGSDWAESPLDALDFANGPSGDTEVRVLWTPASSQKLNLFAFALSRAVGEIQAAQTPDKTNELMQASEGKKTLQEETAAGSWAVFPTTNALGTDATNGFTWTGVGTVTNVNIGQPTARTVLMEVSSPQASGTAWGLGNELDYVIELTNPETTSISNLTISLQATGGLVYLSQSGATCTNCTNSSAWTLSVATLAAGETKTIFVIGKIASILDVLHGVTSAFSLSAGTTVLTPESQVYAAITHRVDGQAPVVTINALGGSAIPAGLATFTGTADDGAEDGGLGSGVAYIEVSLNGGAWILATGSQAWSITLPVSGSPVTLQARAKDYAGIKGDAATHTFYIDSALPTVTWTLPAVTNSSLTSISGTVQDQGPAGSQVRSVEVQIDEAGAWYPTNLLPPQNGSQSWIWNWFTPRDDGVYRKVRVRATDEVGNVSITVSQTTVVDTVAPQITITQRAEYAFLPNDPGTLAPSSSAGEGDLATVEFASATPVTILAGTVVEGSGLNYFHVTVYGPKGFYADVPITNNKGSWIYAPDLTGWSIGSYKLRVLAKDIHSNFSLLGPFTLVVKDTSITSLTASNDGPRLPNQAVTFTASIASGSNVTYTWDFGDGKSGSGRIATHAYAVFGSYTATVTAKNSANTLNASTTVTITPPLQTGPVFTVNSTASTNDHCCDESNCTLREAIEAANNDAVDSTIELSKLDYGLSEVDNTDLQDGAPNLLPQIVTPITINGHGARIYRANQTINGRFFSVSSGAGRLTLNEVWLQGGKLDQASGQTGGAISNYGWLIVKNSLLENNEASFGGAIYNAGTLYLYNNTLYNNNGTFGAIQGNGSFYLYSNTLLNNQGPAISLSLGTFSIYRLYNNLVTKSSVTGTLCNLVPGITMAANLATDSSCTGFGVTTYAALRLARGLPYDEGGPTPSVAITATSYAVDRGNTTACNLAELGGRDQRGYYRFADGNGDGVSACDVGSFEYNSTAIPPAPATDVTPPQVRVLLTPDSPDGANGWYRGPVTVEPQARDTESEVIDMRCALDPEAVPVSYDDLPEELCSFLGGAPVSTDDPHSFYMAAMDLYSNKSGVVSASFQIDATPPSITCPAAGPFLLNSGEQVIGPAGVDASVSGLDEAASTLSGSISTESIGTKLLTFTAFDLAGNSASQECGYAVVYDFGGFYPPVENPPTLNPARAGSAIPFMFSLAGDRGLDVIANGFPTSQQIDCQTLVPIGDPVAIRLAGKSGLGYDPLTGWYKVIWKTDKGWAGTCRVLTLQLVDGTQHVAYFSFQ